MNNIVVSGLSIYPVKSCQGITQNSALVERFGLENDRRWMVVNEHGVMLTQRKISKMCLIQVLLTKSGLVLKAKNMADLSIIKPTPSEKVMVKVWDDECLAFDAGDEAANWLSHFLSVKCRLVYFPNDEFRQVDLSYARKGDKTAFSDGFPLLLISQESLDDLNSRLNQPITMERFRPNIIVSGCDSFAEDTWKKIRIGNIFFRIVKPCSRCVIPSINVETAVREEEPIKESVEEDIVAAEEKPEVSVDVVAVEKYIDGKVQSQIEKIEATLVVVNELVSRAMVSNQVDISSYATMNNAIFDNRQLADGNPAFFKQIVLAGYDKNIYSDQVSMGANDPVAQHNIKMNVAKDKTNQAYYKLKALLEARQ